VAPFSVARNGRIVFLTDDLTDAISISLLAEDDNFLTDALTAFMSSSEFNHDGILLLLYFFSYDKDKAHSVLDDYRCNSSGRMPKLHVCFGVTEELRRLSVGSFVIGAL
jgi:hypothetical protein